MAAVSPVVLGVAWALVVASSGVRAVRTLHMRARARAMRHAGRGRGAVRIHVPVPAVVQTMYTVAARRKHASEAEHAIVRALPATIDLLAVGVNAGLTPFLAVQAAARVAPPATAAVLDGVLARVAAGTGFAGALDAAVASTPVFRPVAAALLASDRYGAPVAPALQRVASEARMAARRRAEVHARRVPVRLLFPLVFLVLPAFALLTVVPSVVSGFAQ